MTALETKLLKMCQELLEVVECGDGRDFPTHEWDAIRTGTIDRACGVIADATSQ